MIVYLMLLVILAALGSLIALVVVPGLGLVAGIAAFALLVGAVVVWAAQLISPVDPDAERRHSTAGGADDDELGPYHRHD